MISPDEGFYRGGRFCFSFKIGANYPHEPPKVKCMTKIYHPNIDLGKYSSNIQTDKCDRESFANHKPFQVIKGAILPLNLQIFVEVS